MLATTPTSATASPNSERGAGRPGAITIPGTSAGWAQYYALRDLVIAENACALPGCPIIYDNFVPAMWRAVATGHVKHEHAVFVNSEPVREQVRPSI